MRLTAKSITHPKTETGTGGCPTARSGGLLSRSHGYSGGNWSTHNAYHADGNGNITYLVNSSQTVAASYRYDAYGNTISSSGSLASDNTYRLPSKMIFATSGIYYYGYRWYDPNLQRWLNRDPIKENGGINLYGFVVNDPTTTIDAFGLDIVVVIVPRRHPEGDKDNGAERAIRRAVIENKQKEGYTVYSASSVADANDKLKKCKDCIKELNVEGHGRGAGMWIGPFRNSESYFAAVPRNDGYDFHNVDSMFGGVDYCKPCTIHLRGCSVASQDGYPELKQKIEAITGCKVDAYAVDCYPGTVRGLSAPTDGSKAQ